MNISKHASGFDVFLLYVPIFASVIFGYFGWMSLGLDNLFSYVPMDDREDWQQWADWGVPFAELLLIIHLSIVWKVCKLIPRYLEILEADGDRYKNMRRALIAVGVVLVIADALIVHIGAEWLLLQSGKHVWWPLVLLGSLGLSIYNMGGEWVFGSALVPKAERLKLEAEEQARVRAENALLEGRPDWASFQKEAMSNIVALKEAVS